MSKFDFSAIKAYLVTFTISDSAAYTCQVEAVSEKEAVNKAKIEARKENIVNIEGVNVQILD